MTGPAKQSILSLLGEMDCFAALAMTVHKYESASSPRNAPESFKKRPPKNRGRRKRRVLAAPAVSRAKVHKEMRTRAYRYSRSIPAFPAQWFYG
jgi:hypothetical protein